VLRRTLAGYAKHPNFAAVILVGLGCESNQIGDLTREHSLGDLRNYTIQDSGGTRKSIARGIELVKEILPTANSVSRRKVSAAHLVVGLQCGGSDGYSGITANPALGKAVDLLVQQGGTAILSETPEIYGAEHLLTRRAVTPEVGSKLLRRFQWWKDYCSRNGASLTNNPSAGNKAGGLTTLLGWHGHLGRDRWPDIRSHAPLRFGIALEERAPRLRPARIRALADSRGDLRSPLSEPRPRGLRPPEIRLTLRRQDESRRAPRSVPGWHRAGTDDRGRARVERHGLSPAR
jgi:hypothetical protein